jgi:hypothetical protein
MLDDGSGTAAYMQDAPATVGVNSSLLRAPGLGQVLWACAKSLVR